MSQYCSDFLIQKKGQEIVENRLRDPFKNAIFEFKARNNGALPTNFIIYRDGVADAQRSQVLTQEIPQFENVISQVYGE